MPNTPVLQEFARLYFDQYYLDLLDEGKQVEGPYIYTVAKGKSKRNTLGSNKSQLQLTRHRNPGAASAEPRPRLRAVVLPAAL
jgi:hypothetical protein